MPTEPVTISTTHDSPLFDPEDHRKAAAEQLGVKPDEIQCIACGPDGATEIKPNLFSQDGTVLQHREVEYSRKTTWELRPRAFRPAPAPPPQPEVQADHFIPTLSRGARWHGVKDGIEGNYISTGTSLVLLDSAEGLALLAAMHGEDVAYERASAPTVRV